MREDIPDAHPPHVAGGLLLEKGANLVDLGPARGCVEEEVAELARVGLHVDGALPRARIALQDEDLVLRAAPVLDGVHGAGQAGLGRTAEVSGGGEPGVGVEDERGLKIMALHGIEGARETKERKELGKGWPWGSRGDCRDGAVYSRFWREGRELASTFPMERVGGCAGSRLRFGLLLLLEASGLSNGRRSRSCGS